MCSPLLPIICWYYNIMKNEIFLMTDEKFKQDFESRKREV